MSGDKSKRGLTYSDRALFLRRLGYSNYSEYLASDQWRAIRKRVYTAKGHHCWLCDAPATELHHNRYHAKDLLGKKLRYISPICRECHHSIEFIDGRKTTVEEAAREFGIRRWHLESTTDVLRRRARRLRKQWAIARAVKKRAKIERERIRIAKRAKVASPEIKPVAWASGI